MYESLEICQMERGCSSVVERVLCMHEVPSSKLGNSMKGSCSILNRLYKKLLKWGLFYIGVKNFCLESNDLCFLK